MLQTQQEVVNTFLPINIVIDAPRISLRSIHPYFASFIHQEYTSDIAECMYKQPCGNFVDTRLRILHDIEKMIQRKLSSFIICDNCTGFPVGCAELQHKKKSPKIGLWIAKNYQHKGFGTEAVLGLQMYAKKNLASHNYVTAIVSKQNTVAKMLFQKLGAELQRHTIHKPNEAGKNGILVTYRLYH